MLHVFVLSEAGKPIYSRYGNESDLSSVMSVMQALVSFVANSGDELQLINTTDKKFLFVSRSHLILVAFSPVSEPTPHLLTCLEYVYNQVCYVVFYFALIFHFIKVSLVKNVVIIG